MATKTISIDIEAYLRLRTSNKEGESFSEAIKRLVPNPFDLKKWLRELAAPFFGFLCLVILVAPFVHSRPVASFIVVILLSTGAYVVRERRHGRPERARRPGAAERKPVLPRG